ncbi:hypothetical protein QZR14_25895 [Pseudomonas sp. rhizo66]|uniref:hypothetical protein n=1 Tax=Pseudomonas sp. rhizo66 TaxID=3059674 RepID=UPI0028904833|nr:hypothetical protein [Pseudomonas sp. rhizo66]MDT3314803.1 hypothetical protein [Pseudomonas sp. rhizo66]
MALAGTIVFYSAEEQSGQLIVDLHPDLDPKFHLCGGRMSFFKKGEKFEKGQRVWCGVGITSEGQLFAKDVRSYSD